MDRCSRRRLDYRTEPGGTHDGLAAAVCRQNLHPVLHARQHGLGGVDSRDSLLGANQIQGCFWEGWSLKGVWWRIFEAMSDDPDFEYLIVDSTIVRADQHAAGAKKGGLKIRRSVA